MLTLLKSYIHRPVAQPMIPRRLLSSPEPSQEHVSPLFRVGQLHGRDMYEVSIDELQEAFAKGHFTSRAYTRFCMERIQKIDFYLESIIEINPDALSIAAGLDEERRRGSIRGPLHGIPVLVKDNMATKDKMQTTAGSWALLGSVVPRDAYVVSELRNAGAIILGHANMTEWASLRSKNYSGAYSPRRGEVRNPYDLSMSPYGSSAGSAVAVSANIVPLSFGTETDSSIIGPAGINGVVGIKPTVGLTSRSGVIPISENMDTVGTFGRTVKDAVYGLNAIAKPDDKDSWTLDPSRGQEVNYSTFIADKSALKGARFGLPWNRCWEFVPKDQMDVAQKVLDAIEHVGGKVVRTDFPSAYERIPEDGEWDWEYGEPDQSEFTVIRVDAYNSINSYLSECSDTEVKSLEDVVQYNIDNTGSEGANPGDHPAFPSGQDNLLEIVASRGQKGETYRKALKYIQQKSREDGIDGALKHHDGPLDALLLCDRKAAGQQMAAQAGYPIISIPIGVDSEGLPVALTLQHTAWQDGILIRYASAIEDLVNELSGWRVTPSFRNHMAKNIPVFE